MMALNGIDMMALYHQPRGTLIKWYQMLNTWKWPDDLPDPEEPIYTNVKYTRRSKIMDWIVGRVGMKAILREHNKKRMLFFEFKDFWEGNFKGNKAARDRYNNRHQKKALKECFLRYYPRPSIDHRFLYDLNPSHNRYKLYLREKV